MNPPKVGFKYLPEPIIRHLQKQIKFRPPRPHVYHVTELIYCLRKAYYRRTIEKKATFNTKSLWNINRGNTFDKKWGKLFKINQKNYRVHRLGLTISGTLDFVYDANDGDGDVLYDLKMPASTFWKKKSGAGLSYRRQVAAYLALAHANNELLHVTKGRVLMIAEDVVVDEQKEWPHMLDRWLWPRAFKLDRAIETNDPSNLKGPEEGWECGFCSADKKFREGCPRVIGGVVIG